MIRALKRLIFLGIWQREGQQLSQEDQGQGPVLPSSPSPGDRRQGAQHHPNLPHEENKYMFSKQLYNVTVYVCRVGLRERQFIGYIAAQISLFSFVESISGRSIGHRQTGNNIWVARLAQEYRSWQADLQSRWTVVNNCPVLQLLRIFTSSSSATSASRRASGVSNFSVESR